MKNKLLILALVSTLQSSILDVANADNANPPKIVSVEQVTKGPYSRGDIVTFKVNYTGGFPGIERITISILCVNNSHSAAGSWTSQIGWTKKEKVTASSGNGLISGYITSCFLDGKHIREVQPTMVSITDETGLSSTLNNEELMQNTSLKLQVNQSDLVPTPVGEIKPQKIPDEVVLGVPSKLRLNQIFSLPRLSKSGVPIMFRTNSKKVCDIDWDTFEGDLGGKLRTIAPGVCLIRMLVSPNDKYGNPTVRTDRVIKPSKSGVLGLNFTVSKNSKINR